MKVKQITPDVLCPNCGNSMRRPPTGAIGKCDKCEAMLRAPGPHELWCGEVGAVELQAVAAGVGRGLVGGGGRIG